MTDALSGYRLLSILEDIARATTTEAVFELYQTAISEIGAVYLGMAFIPGPDDRFEEVFITCRTRPDWVAHYLRENHCQRDPAFRLARRTVIPFDWASAPYDPETEPHMKEVMDRAHDFNVDKGISVSIPSSRGIIGVVWVAGPDFDEREVHKPVLHTLALYAFHRVEQLLGTGRQKNAGLTQREREVMGWVSEGKTAWEIGRILNLSQRTIEWHIRQVCQKLGAINRLQAVAILSSVRATIDPIVEAPRVSR